MPKISLNKYQKIGLVLSLIWIVAVFFIERNSTLEKAGEMGKWAYQTCVDAQANVHNTDLSGCDVERVNMERPFLEGHNTDALLSAIVPIPFLWLATFILFYIGRGIKIGYQAVVPWSSLNSRKKIYAGSCLFALAIVGYVGLLEFLNGIADSRVPVGMAKGVPLYVGAEGDMVYFKGTWTRHGLSEGSGIAYPINISSFQCNRKEMECIEAQAQVLGDNNGSGHTLSADLVTHSLDTWTDTEITYKEEGFCATSTYTIDLKSGAVNGVGRLINIGKPNCNPLHIEADNRDTSWTLTLANDSFSIYWAERKKAMPRLAKYLTPWAF